MVQSYQACADLKQKESVKKRVHPQKPQSYQAKASPNINKSQQFLRTTHNTQRTHNKSIQGTEKSRYTFTISCLKNSLTIVYHEQVTQKLGLILTSVLKRLIALNHFLWVTVFCIYRELVLGQSTMWMSFDFNIGPSFL